MGAVSRYFVTLMFKLINAGLENWTVAVWSLTDKRGFITCNLIAVKFVWIA